MPSPGLKWNRKVRQCKGWAASAIYGDWSKGRGILLNRLYVGEYIWNRTQRRVDPKTKQRRNRQRPESEWVVNEMPELRIVPQDLWDRVQSRFKTQRERGAPVRAALRSTGRGPKYLFSGLLKCGVCNGSYIIVTTNKYGCATHKDRGPHICTNHMRVRRKIVEDKLLAGIKQELFTVEAIKVFKRELARVLAERRQQSKPNTEAVRRELAQTEKEIENIMSAIKAGIITPTTKAELEKAEAVREKLLAALKVDIRSHKVLDFLPHAMDRYRQLVNNLGDIKDVARARAQIKHLLGGQVKLIPTVQGYLEAELKGDYAGLCKMAVNSGAEERTWPLSLCRRFASS